MKKQNYKRLEGETQDLLLESGTLDRRGFGAAATNEHRLLGKNRKASSHSSRGRSPRRAAQGQCRGVVSAGSSWRFREEPVSPFSDSGTPLLLHTASALLSPCLLPPVPAKPPLPSSNEDPGDYTQRHPTSSKTPSPPQDPELHHTHKAPSAII